MEISMIVEDASLPGWFMYQLADAFPCTQKTEMPGICLQVDAAFGETLGEILLNDCGSGFILCSPPKLDFQADFAQVYPPIQQEELGIFRISQAVDPQVFRPGF